MFEPTGGTAQEMIRVCTALADRLEKLDLPRSAATHTTQTTNINAGGVGVLLALLACAFLAGLNITQAINNAKMSAEINDIRRRNDLANDKLSVVLQWSPELAKKVDDSINKKGSNAP